MSAAIHYVQRHYHADVTLVVRNKVRLDNRAIRNRIQGPRLQKSMSVVVNASPRIQPYLDGPSIAKLSIESLAEALPRSGFPVILIAGGLEVTSRNPLIIGPLADLDRGELGCVLMTWIDQDAMFGTRMTHVPYKGSGFAMNDLLGGQIKLIFTSLPLAIPQIKSNRLRGIAVTAAKRANAVPDIPTVGETVTGYGAAQWYAFLGPRALPKDIVVRWSSELNRILNLADVKERMARDGMEPPAAGTPERFREMLKSDVAKWQNVVKISNIKPGS